MLFEAGGAIGDYRLVRPLGTGELSEVWLADDFRRGRQVALKFLRTEKFEPKHLARFKREFEFLAALKHPHLGRVTSFGCPPLFPHYFFVSDYSPGSDFFTALASKDVSYFEEALVQLLLALDYIHSEGVIHFDIKAENVLVEGRNGHPFVTLVDFGLAARLQGLPTGRPGTLAYMAPELLVKSPAIDHRADLYSLGILCLRAVSGRWPFSLDHPEEIAAWHLRGSVPEELWRGAPLPPYLREIIEKLLAKRASERFSHARVVLRFLNLAADRKYAALEREGGPGGIEFVEGPLVHRKGELEQVEQEFRKAMGFASDGLPASSVFFVTGEQGIGKSRFLEEFRHFVELQEIPVFDWTCAPEVAGWPELAARLEIPVPGETAPTSEQATSFDDLPDLEWVARQRADALIARASVSPFCLLIDDFQRAEATTRELITALQERTKRECAEGRKIPLFVLVASEVGEGLSLPRLDSEDILLYAHHVLGEVDGIRELGNLLYRYSGGLPLLVVEGLRYLAPRLLRGESLVTFTFPTSVADLYRDKIAALDRNERELLRIVALLGRPAREDELAMILESPADAMALESKRCLQWGLLKKTVGREPSETYYQISSEALGLQLIHRLTTAQRQQLHRRIAVGLEKIGRALPDELASHMVDAGWHEKGRRLYQEAALYHRNKGEIVHAVRCLQQAILFTVEGSKIWETLLLDAIALLILSGSYREAQSLLGRLEDFPSYRREEARGWLALKQRQFDDARRSYQLALRLLPEGHDLKRVQLQNALAEISLQQGDYERAVHRFREALVLEEALPLEERVHVVNNHLGLALAMQGKFQEAIQFFQTRLHRYSPEQQAAARVACLNALGFVLLQASRFQEAIHSFRQALELARHSGVFHHLFSVMGNLLTALLKENRYAECLQLMEQMISHQGHFGTERDVAFNWLRCGSVYLNLGMEEAAGRCLRRGRQIADEIADRNLLGWFLLMDGYWEREFGCLEKGGRNFQAAEKQAHASHDEELQNWTLYAMAELAFEEGAFERCQSYLQRIRNASRDREFEVRQELLRAKLAVRQKKELSPDSLFESLALRCRQESFPELLWEVYAAWGEVVLLQGDRRRAITLYGQGMQVIRSLLLALPEEYHDRYLHQRSRRRFYQTGQRLMNEGALTEVSRPA